MLESKIDFINFRIGQLNYKVALLVSLLSCIASVAAVVFTIGAYYKLF